MWRQHARNCGIRIAGTRLEIGRAISPHLRRRPARNPIERNSGTEIVARLVDDDHPQCPDASLGRKTLILSESSLSAFTLVSPKDPPIPS
jgi:hypothetical protein